MLIAGNKLYVANVGDTRALLRRGGKAVRLTYDHKPYNPEEVKRIRDVGGFVSGDVGRVNGVIAVARSIGDFCAYPSLSVYPLTSILKTLSHTCQLSRT